MIARPATKIEGYNVYDATHDRIRWLFKEFDGKVAVTFSGGKDSTAVMEIAARVAREEGHGPLKVWFLDQEAEFQSTVNYMRYIHGREDIDLRWYQVPFPMENSMNLDDPYFRVWDETKPDEWVRPKEPYSIHDDVYSKGKRKNFYKMLDAIARADFPGYALLDGMRAEESPNRRVSMVSKPVYKWVTWSAVKRPDGGCRFHPIWDWSYRDVWKSIHDNDWEYCRHYDGLFRIGRTIPEMRVSSFTHAMSARSIDTLQELEPETWERALVRFPGISSLSHLTRKGQHLDKPPYMFNSWEEYMHYLNMTLIEPEKWDMFLDQFDALRRAYPSEEQRETVAAVNICSAIIRGDHHGTGTKSLVSAARRREGMRQ